MNSMFTYFFCWFQLFCGWCASALGVYGAWRETDRHIQKFHVSTEKTNRLLPWASAQRVPCRPNQASSAHQSLCQCHYARWRMCAEYLLMPTLLIECICSAVCVVWIYNNNKMTAHAIEMKS